MAVALADPSANSRRYWPRRWEGQSEWAAASRVRWL